MSETTTAADRCRGVLIGLAAGDKIGGPSRMAVRLAESLLEAAQATPQGRARLALVSAVSDVPGWFSPATAEPAANDFAARENNQFQWSANVNFPFLHWEYE